MLLSTGSRLRGRNSYVDSMSCSPRSGVLARFSLAYTQQTWRSEALESREQCFGMLQSLQT
eukprot:3783802-Pyramimonas_sp.AAC.1